MGCNEAELFVYTLLGSVYGALAIFGIIRCRKIINFEWRQAQCFYVLLVLQCLMRSVTLLLACDLILQHSHVILLSIPESMFIVCYLILFWQLLTLFYYSHFDHHFHTRFFRDVSQHPQQSSTSLMFLFLFIVWIGTQVALLVACLTGRIDSFSVRREVAVGNLAIPTVALVSMVGFQLKYSGIPLRGPSWRSKLVKMNLVTLVWSVGRLLSGSLSITDEHVDDLDAPGNTYETEIIVIYLVVSEILCIVLVLDFNFLQIFLLVERSEIENQSTEPLSSSQRPDESEDVHFSIISSTPAIPPHDVTILSDLPGRAGGFGTLKLGRYKEKDVFCRRLDFPRTSHFVLEGLKEEIAILQGLAVWGLLPYYGAIVQPPAITIVTPFMPNGSLFDLLHDPNKRQRLYTKLTICLKVAHTLAQLADIQIHHGHLSSHNILLDSHLTPFIGDIGMARIKKYATITLGYNSKNAWTSPEILNDRAAAVLSANEKSDIYSFGMVLWEVVTEQEPFPGVSWQKLAEVVGVEGLRPELPGDVPSVVSRLILSCWNTEPEKRPVFTLVESTLQSYLQGDL